MVRTQKNRPRPVKSVSSRERRWKNLRRLAIVVAPFAVVVALTVIKDRSLWTSAEQLVTVYRIHGCRCAFAWAKSLERNGFVVQMREVGSLKSTRRTLQTPVSFKGCHVAAHLGYFVEGHVDPAALRKLAQQHPAALGLVTETSATPALQHVDLAAEARSRVLLVEPGGKSALWFQPSRSTEEGA